MRCNGGARWRKRMPNGLNQYLLPGLSVRAWQRLLKVSRTIADLAGEEALTRSHLLEALSYRGMDRMLIHLHKSTE